MTPDLIISPEALRSSSRKNPCGLKAFNAFRFGRCDRIERANSPSPIDVTERSAGCIFEEAVKDYADFRAQWLGRPMLFAIPSNCDVAAPNNTPSAPFLWPSRFSELSFPLRLLSFLRLTQLY